MKTSTFLRNSVAIAAFSLVCSPLVKAQEIAHGSIFLQELEMRDNDAPSDPSKSNGHTNVKAVVIDNTTWAWISMNADECYAGIGSEDFVRKTGIKPISSYNVIISQTNQTLTHITSLMPKKKDLSLSE